MKTLLISTVALLLAFPLTVSAQDTCGPNATERDENGFRQAECSHDTGTLTSEALEGAIRSATNTRLRAVFDHNERVDCYSCIPAVVDRIFAEGTDAETREFAAWWLRRRAFALSTVVRGFRNVLEVDADPNRRAIAAGVLGELRVGSSVSALGTAAMTDTAAPVRLAAVQALGVLNHPGAAAAFRTAITDADANVRREAIRSAIRLHTFEDEIALMPGLSDTDASVRREAALLMGRHQVDEAVPGLVALLADDDSGARRDAAWALGRIGGTDARNALNARLEAETQPQVQDAIRFALLQ